MSSENERRLGAEEQRGVNKDRGFVLNNIQVTLLPIEHTIPDFVANEGRLRDIIADSDATIFEYFPHEIETQNPSYASEPQEIKAPSRANGGGIGEYHALYWKEIKPFFSRVAEICKGEPEHKALVLDPAHDSWFAYIQYNPMSTAIETIGALSMLPTKTDKEMTRRKLLAMGGVAGAAFAATVLGMGVTMLERHVDIPLPGNEATFRRAVIAKGIEKLSLSEQFSGKKINLLYPPAHVQGIISMLNNPIWMETAISLRSRDILMLVPQLRESLFTMREYAWDGNNWQRNILGQI